MGSVYFKVFSSLAAAAAAAINTLLYFVATATASINTLLYFATAAMI